MNKTLIAIAVGSLLPLAALAATPQQTATTAPDAHAAAAAAAEPAIAAAAATPAKPGLADRRCLHETGSHIPARRSARRDDGCLQVNGRSYSRDDLQRTGEVDIANALRRLDPAIH